MPLRGNRVFLTLTPQRVPAKVRGFKEVWAYLMLHSAKIEAEKSPDSKIVLFKFAVNMSELLKAAKAEKYEKYISE